MPSWGTVATHKAHFSVSPGELRHLLAFLVLLPEAEKFSHLILDNILSLFPFLFHGVQFGWECGEERGWGSF